MKAKIIAAIMVATIFAASPVSAGTPWRKNNYYPMLCKVTRVTYNRNRGWDRVRLRNANHQIYVCWTGRGDYDRGDYVSVIMDSKGTDLVFDDEVVAIKYERPDLLG